MYVRYHCATYSAVGSMILESMASEAATQRSDLAILCNMWRLFGLPGKLLVLAWCCCITHPLCSSLSWPEGVQNPIQRRWSFLLEFHLWWWKFGWNQFIKGEYTAIEIIKTKNDMGQQLHTDMLKFILQQIMQKPVLLQTLITDTRHILFNKKWHGTVTDRHVKVHTRPDFFF
jgi:hypothetical protein